jgi:hypothetical protein
MNENNAQNTQQSVQSIVVINFLKSCLVAADEVERRKAVRLRSQKTWGPDGFREFVNSLLSAHAERVRNGEIDEEDSDLNREDSCQAIVW